MPFEADTPPPINTFRRFVWQTTTAFAYWRAYWGRRLAGGAIGLMADLLSEGGSQSFYARLPGHPEQALDSLIQVGKDRDLYRFRGESDADYLQRVIDAWDDYDQAGTPQQMLHVLNQWGAAGWPGSWNPANLTLTESGSAVDFSFTIMIAFGSISPAWTPEVYGGTHVYGESGFFYGLSAETDLAMLVYLVRKWKPARSIGKIQVFISPSDSVTIVVA